MIEDIRRTDAIKQIQHVGFLAGFVECGVGSNVHPKNYLTAKFYIPDAPWLQ